jgi:hypothetical protein
MLPVDLEERGIEESVLASLSDRSVSLYTLRREEQCSTADNWSLMASSGRVGGTYDDTALAGQSLDCKDLHLVRSGQHMDFRRMR